MFGRLADIVGRRPLYLGGLAVFAVASAACVFAPSAEWLIVARILQGVGAGAVVTNNTALLTDVFPTHLLGRALGWNATVAALGQVVGPLIGGAATALLGWHGLFLVVTPLAVIATVTSVLVIPRSPRVRRRREHFDVVGALLSTTLLTGIVLALTPGLSGPAWMPFVYGTGSMVLAVVMVAWFVRRSEPLIDLTLFRDRRVGIIMVAALLTAVTTYAVPLIISLFEQAAEGTSPFVAGILVMPVALGTVLAASVAGSVVNRYSPRTLMAIGLVLITMGLGGMTLLLTPDSTPRWASALCLALIGMGIGLFMTPSTSALMLTVDPQRRGIANGLRSMLQNVGNLLGTALILSIATIGLGASAREATYAGATDSLGAADIGVLIGNLRWGGLVLTVVAAIGVLVCLMFPRTPVTVTPVDLDDDDPISVKEPV